MNRNYYNALLNWVKVHPDATLPEYYEARDKLREKHNPEAEK